MAGSQTSGIAYGHPSIGGIAVGFGRSSVYTLGSVSVRRSGMRLSISVPITVHADSSETLHARVGVLNDIVRQRGNFGYTAGTATVTATVDTTFASKVLTVTATSGTPFLATHVGLPIVIGTREPLQITEYVSPTVVRCRISSLAADLSGATGETAIIATVVARCDEATKAGGFDAKASLDRVTDPDDTAFRWSYVLSLEYQVAGSDYRPDEVVNSVSQVVDRSEAVAEFSDPFAGSRQVIFSGQFTAASSQDAKARYDAQILNWVADQMESYMPGVSYETVGSDVLTIPDTGNLVQFHIVRREINPFWDQLSASAEANLSGATVNISVQQLYNHGFSGGRVPAALTCTYRADVLRGQTATQIKALWDTEIYSLLVAQIESVWGSRVMVTGSQTPSIDPILNVVRASFQGVLPGTGSRITNYLRRVRMQHSERRQFLEVLDGTDFSALEYSRGPAVSAVVSVEFTELDAGGSGGGIRTKSGLGGVSSSLGQAFGVFAGGKKLTFDVGLDGDGSGGGSSKKIAYNPMGEPPSAKEFFGRKPYQLQVSDGAWRSQDTIPEESSRVIEDPLGVGATGVERTVRLVRTFEWRKIAVASSGRKIDPQQNSLPPTGSRLSTVRRHPDPSGGE